MYLALESLGVVQPRPTIVDELIDHLQLIEAEDALRASLEEMDALLYTYQSLESIHQTIKAHGVTQSIVYLYGENFSSMENDQTTGAEKEVDEKKQGVLKRIWEAIKNLFEKFWKWVMGLFDPALRINKKLRDVETKVDRVQYPIEASIMTRKQLLECERAIWNVLESFKVNNCFDRLAKTAIVCGIAERLEKLKDNKVTISSSEELKDIISTHIEFCEWFLELEDEYRRKFNNLVKQNKNAKTPDQRVTEDQFETAKENLELCILATMSIMRSSRNIIAIFK